MDVLSVLLWIIATYLVIPLMIIAIILIIIAVSIIYEMVKGE